MTFNKIIVTGLIWGAAFIFAGCIQHSSTAPQTEISSAQQSNKQNSNKQNTSKTIAAVQPQMIPASLLVLKPQEGLVYYLDKPFSGTSISYFDEQQKEKKATSTNYLNGKKHGFYQKWFDTGTLSFESSYLNGKKHGSTKSWWKNGNLRSESNFQKGVAQGIQKQWYKSGAKFKQLHLVNGQEEGMQQSWRENGKIYNNYQAKNGRIFGLKRANLCYQLEDEVIQYKDQ